MNDTIEAAIKIVLFIIFLFAFVSFGNYITGKGTPKSFPIIEREAINNPNIMCFYNSNNGEIISCYKK